VGFVLVICTTCGLGRWVALVRTGFAVYSPETLELFLLELPLLATLLALKLNNCLSEVHLFRTKISFVMLCLIYVFIFRRVIVQAFVLGVRLYFPCILLFDKEAFPLLLSCSLALGLGLGLTDPVRGLRATPDALTLAVAHHISLDTSNVDALNWMGSLLGIASEHRRLFIRRQMRLRPFVALKRAHAATLSALVYCGLLLLFLKRLLFFILI